ncbi:MAG TPA: bifunctional DNA-formamidopyrimidine glycosylase/DNA-(apurinic or apyrimidinic site) lyase [Candidatus Eremiobacteraceae bacterium]|nr:bifunctional DNA-formamidopyrimidine glycosylase/DNA-(apurinic or apyrimidinic site) lyase [Candidatus Eremiobacteraceae bacterium]
MPELPEVETIARGLHARVRGKRIATIGISWQRTVDARSLPLSALAGKQINGVTRIGKFVAIELSGGFTLAVHLRMTGRLLVGSPNVQVHAHERARITFRDASVLTFSDARKFGRMRLLRGDAAAQLAVGRDPLDPQLTSNDLKEMMAGRRTPVKVWLLDQRRLSGIGNIYASEALFFAGIRPRRAAGRLTSAECAGLLKSLRLVLRRAIRSGGSSLNDYVDSEGKEGSFQKQFSVYGRSGLHCLQCRGPVRRIVLAQRSTFYCSTCQR